MVIDHSRAFPHRVVLAFDLDNFYVACERLRNPDLLGKPVGIVQKRILATCSYEARDKGVKKLQPVTDALRACPDIVLVNGEDLTHYRAYSRAISRLVKSIVWDGAEKLGMDELFCDVTSMVHRHIKDLEDLDLHYGKQIFFNLEQSEEPRPSESRGFMYSHDTVHGHRLPDQTPTSHSRELRIASHLAAYIRKRILEELCFTTSGGIAHNKLLAKLIASENKPNDQTCWDPNLETWKEEQAAYIAPKTAASLNGYGYAFRQTLGEYFATLPNFTPTTIAKEGSLWGPDAQGSDLASLLSRSLTVSDIRANTAFAQYKTWLGDRLAPKLWAMLEGTDEDPVKPSPEYPLQISVEESYQNLNTWELISQQLSILCVDFLERLELELIREPAELAKLEGIPSMLRGDVIGTSASTGDKWQRYPSQLRLTIRDGRAASRESKSSAFPVDTFDLALPLKNRAETLANGVCTKLMKSILAGRKSFLVNILNIAATNFSTSPPSSSSIQAIFSSTSSASTSTKRKASVHQDFLAAMPPEIRKELEAQSKRIKAPTIGPSTAKRKSVPKQVSKGKIKSSVDEPIVLDDDDDGLIIVEGPSTIPKLKKKPTR